jgi:LytS/YehU family sensor histidine kinase
VDSYFRTLNAFIEDTSVLVAVAFLLARGRMLALLCRERRTAAEMANLALVLGLIGLTEEAFPGARFPYVMHSLMVTFASVVGGLRVGLLTAAVAAAGALALQGPATAAGTLVSLCAGALLVRGLHRVTKSLYRLPTGFGAGLLTQSCFLLTQLPAVGLGHAGSSLAHYLATIPANAFGTMLLLLVVDDARLRAESERHRAEAERAQSLVTEAQLNALRARVHPHFLFNALTSIAALCSEAPAKAEAATVRLGQLMRRVLETDGTRPLCLSDEISQVQGYLEMEQLRLGARLCVSWQMDNGCEQLRVPPFAIQTLVENAVQHGIAPQIGPGHICIMVRRRTRHALIAVIDDGVGMSAGVRRAALSPAGRQLHGLQILTQQLILLHGPRSRLRLFSQVDQGTLAAFQIPGGEVPLRQELLTTR